MIVCNAYLMYRLYFMITPFVSAGGSHETRSDWDDLTTTLISAGGPGTAKPKENANHWNIYFTLL